MCDQDTTPRPDTDMGGASDVAGPPRVGAAGAREDSEAGTSAEEKVPDTRDTMSKANEAIIGSIVGDREPGDAPPPSGPTQQDKESQRNSQGR
jgi:hypothetical protein